MLQSIVYSSLKHINLILTVILYQAAIYIRATIRIRIRTILDRNIVFIQRVDCDTVCYLLY